MRQEGIKSLQSLSRVGLERVLIFFIRFYTIQVSLKHGCTLGLIIKCTLCQGARGGAQGRAAPVLSLIYTSKSADRVLPQQIQEEMGRGQAGDSEDNTGKTLLRPWKNPILSSLSLGKLQAFGSLRGPFWFTGPRYPGPQGT